LVARKRNFSVQQVLFFSAFGAGILMAAAVFEMVIEAEEHLGIVFTILAFLAGAIIFTLADVIAEKKVVELAYCWVSDWIQFQNPLL
jgi:ZIP family zinc transporter